MPKDQRFSAVVLAAGKGTRMRSSKPKVMHTLLGSPMLAYVLASLEPVFGDQIFVISGHAADQLENAFQGIAFIRQAEQLGTGHALMQAMPGLEAGGAERVLVINGDAPLVSAPAISDFVEAAKGADLAFATITMADAGSYGRVILRDGKLAAIIEARDFDPALHGPDAGLVNAGLYCFSIEALQKLLPRIGNANASGEYYITDLIGLALESGFSVRPISCGDDLALLGVNTPAELAQAEDLLARRTAERLLANGVIIHNPGQLRASPLAEIAPGCEISAPCEIYGRSILESGCEVGPYCLIRDSAIRAGAKIHAFSHLAGAQVGQDAIVGPYARLRPGAVLMREAHVGNFVELKKTVLGAGAKANHLTYLGDSEIGAGTNIGAGTITCNYDGKNKFQTVIGENCFIGSNSSLVAPVAIGADALVAAGSVVTGDVPPHMRAFGRARQVNKPKK